MNATAFQAKGEQRTIKEGATMLGILRALGNEDQRIAFAVLEGMKLQKAISQQSGGTSLKACGTQHDELEGGVLAL